MIEMSLRWEISGLLSCGRESLEYALVHSLLAALVGCCTDGLGRCAGLEVRISLVVIESFRVLAPLHQHPD